MDKLVKKFWDKYSCDADHYINKLINEYDFERAVLSYNLEHKCENCKKENKKNITISNPDFKAVWTKYSCNGIEIISSKFANCSPYCFTNLFELKED